MEATYSGSFVRKVRINKRPVYKIEKIWMAQPSFFIPKKALDSCGRISVGRLHFSFPLQKLNAPLHSVTTDLLGADLEKTTCKRFIPPTQDAGVTLTIIGV